MNNVTTFKFNKNEFQRIKEFRFGYNWPTVYILENGKEIYIGETTNLYIRSKQHIEKPERKKLKNIHIISDEEYNKSAALDTESMLIEHIVADGKFIVQNGNKGIANHNYYDKQKYQAKFEELWDTLRKMGLAQNELIQIRNTDLFKYSPYKSLTVDQLDIYAEIKKILKSNEARSIVVEGGPGTGKTILATFIVKNLLQLNDFSGLKVGFVIPMVSLRKTLRKVFSRIKGLSSKMVIGPGDVIKEEYDLLIVDEAHRLRQRKNIANYKSHDYTNKFLNLEKEGTELDWILARSKQQIFFYDKNQSVKPADVDHGRFANLPAERLELKKQMRVKGGERYIEFIADTLEMEPPESNFEEYDFRVFDSLPEMIEEIKGRNAEYGLSRVVAGYAWPWETRKKRAEFDIELDGLKLKWNSTLHDWVNSKNSINEIGCIHTVQGYDLNYAGVIIGPELSCDPATHSLVVNEEKYKDINGKKTISDPQELKRYILNIYKTLLTRGIYGTYVYAADENLRQYLKDAAEGEEYT